LRAAGIHDARLDQIAQRLEERADPLPDN